jgi:hypothetical protein
MLLYAELPLQIASREQEVSLCDCKRTGDLNSIVLYDAVIAFMCKSVLGMTVSMKKATIHPIKDLACWTHYRTEGGGTRR